MSVGTIVILTLLVILIWLAVTGRLGQLTTAWNSLKSKSSTATA